MENKRLRRQLKRMAGSACFLMLAGATFTSCDDDLLTGTPEWLGSSIYAELQERGNFTEMLKLINDEVLASGDYPRTLNQTGSKTLFVADDAAWARFYEKNPWGVKKMSDMSVYVNTDTAKEIGVEIPASILDKATTFPQ